MNLFKTQWYIFKCCFRCLHSLIWKSKRQQWQVIEMLILCPDNIQARGTCVPLLMNWVDRSAKCLAECNFGGPRVHGKKTDLGNDEKQLSREAWRKTKNKDFKIVQWLSNCWVNTYGYKHLGWLHYFDFIRNWPLKTVNKTGYHDGVKTTPKWYIELGLIGLKPFTLHSFSSLVPEITAFLLS